MTDISGKITTEKTSNVQSTNPPEVQSTKSPKVHLHPNLFSGQLWSVQPTSLKDISRLPFSVMKPLQSISGMAPPPGFIDSSHSGIIANNSCSFLLFLKNLGASKKQMKWAKELVNSGRLPTEFKLDSFIQLMKNIKAKEKTTDLKMLSKLIEGFLNLFQTNVEKKEKSKKDVESFLKHSHERAPCAKGGEGKKDKKKGTEKDKKGTEKDKKGAEMDSKKGETEAMINELLCSLIDNAFSSIFPDHYKFLTDVSESDAVSAFILAVMTTDNRSVLEESFNFLAFIDDFDECNIVEVLFEHVFRVSLAFWRAHIQESNKTDTFHVSLKEVEAYMLGFLRAWGGFVFGEKISTSTITRLYNDVMHGLAFLSGCGSQSSKLVNVSLAIIHHVLQNIDSLVYVKLDGSFFQNVGECLGFEQRSRVLEDGEIELFYNMTPVEKEINGLRESSWGKLCYRAGLSNDRQRILDFLSAMYKRDLKNSLSVLRTFVGSGKTASLSLLMLLKLMIGQSAVFMTPCSSEVINFFAGIRFQIEGLISSNEFKSLKKDDSFKQYMLELIVRLDKLRVFESPLAFGQKLDPTFINIFVLAPTQANILWLLGNRYDMLVLDDVLFAHELARRVSMQGHGCAIIVSGADVGEFDAGDFLSQGYTTYVCDIQNRIDVKSIWCDSTCGRDDLAFDALGRVFGRVLVPGSLKYSDLWTLFQTIGISVKGNVEVSSFPVYKAKEIFEVLRHIAVDPQSAVAKLYGLYQTEMLMLFDTRMKFGDKAIVYQTDDESYSIATLLSSLLKVEDETYVAPTFSKDSFVVSQNESDANDDEKGNSNPQSSCGDETLHKKKDKNKEGTKKDDIKDARKKAEEDDWRKSSNEVPTRPATIEDIRLKKLVAQNPLRLTPSQKQINVFKTLVANLNIPENYKTALITLFENGVGRVSRIFPSEYNEFVASVFRENMLSYLSTSYPLESMNLGHVSAVIVMSSISERDLRQLLGRMNRPNNGSFLQMLEDGRLVLIILDDACQDDVGGPIVGGVAAGQHLDFKSIMDFGISLHIPENVSALYDVLREIFARTSSMFPIDFQRRILSLFLSTIFRVFHPEMHLSDKMVLPRDCACVISSAIDLTQFPIIESGNTSNILRWFFGITSESMENVFGGFAHFMPVLCATKVSEIQGFDTPKLIVQVLFELCNISRSIECALCVVSMTTPMLAGMKRVIHERMSIIVTLLSKTSTHLQVLITLFETKRATMLRNLEKSEAKLGVIVCESAVNPTAIIFLRLVESTLDALPTDLDFDKLRVDIHEFISSHSESELVANATMFLEKVKDLEQDRKSFFENTSRASSVCADLCQQRAKLSVLLEWSTSCLSTVVNSKGKSFNLFEILTTLKVGKNGQILLASVNALTKKPEFQDVLTEFYGELCGLLVRAGFLQQGQCDSPDSDGNVSVGAFNALTRAIEEFSKTVPADLSAVNARLAELTVEIDRVQQELCVLRDVFESKINSLRHFTKIS
jgi:hypothetical protein